MVASALSWGLGYLPLRRWGRAAVALTAGVVGSVVAANATVGAWSVVPDGGGEASLRQASLLWAGVIVAAVLVLVLDTWRLAHRHRPTAANPAPHSHEPGSSTGIRKRA